MSTTLSYSTVKTRKPHRCRLCGVEAPAGTQMDRGVWKDMGILVLYTHPECERAARWQGWDDHDYECHSDEAGFRERTLAAYRASLTTAPKEKP